MIQTNIPISEEWLVKFGFSEGFGWKGSGKFTNNLDSSLVITCKKDTSAFYISKYLKTIVLTYEIKYVHQLQSLYFALTGKELELIESKVNSV